MSNVGQLRLRAAVRWVSRTALCVIPLEASTIGECSSRPAQPHPDSLYRQVRAALSATGASTGAIACLRFSREISSGDSSVIVVGMVGTAVVDNMVESESKWVWFRRGKGTDSVWIGQDPWAVVSDVAPMTLESKC